MPPAAVQSTAPAPVADHRPTALTPRGSAAARLSDFEDCWKELNQADRAYFADWLTSLLVDACQEPTLSGRR